jgi:hypothetical protein
MPNSKRYLKLFLFLLPSTLSTHFHCSVVCKNQHHLDHWQLNKGTKQLAKGLTQCSCGKYLKRPFYLLL